MRLYQKRTQACAGVLNAPVVFLVQNNGYAISVPLSAQSAAPSLAHKAVGYGMPGRLVDGNDAPAVHAVLTEAFERARGGGGPTLVEALTYRVEAHTNADDATRYRSGDEVQAWLARDPITRLEACLTTAALLDERAAGQVAAEAERFAERLRDRMNHEVRADPADLFAHVYTRPTAALEQQQAALLREMQGSAP